MKKCRVYVNEPHSRQSSYEFLSSLHNQPTFTHHPPYIYMSVQSWGHARMRHFHVSIFNMRLICFTSSLDKKVAFTCANRPPPFRVGLIWGDEFLIMNCSNRLSHELINVEKKTLYDRLDSTPKGLSPMSTLLPQYYSDGFMDGKVIRYTIWLRVECTNVEFKSQSCAGEITKVFRSSSICTMLKSRSSSQSFALVYPFLVMELYEISYSNYLLFS